MILRLLAAIALAAIFWDIYDQLDELHRTTAPVVIIKTS